jgi:cytochrome c biogenesis protein CcmG/thiol:disulfide interchange protein DsbE
MSAKREREARRHERLERERAEAHRAARRRMVRWASAVGLAVLAAGAVAAVAATGGSGGSSSSPPTAANSPAPSKAATKGVPVAVARNVAQGNRVVDGSIDDRIRALRGTPVVVNQWASWCPNCKAEFGFFQQAARQHRRDVAFLGLDSQDNRGDAEAFLSSHPVPYPSVYDQSAGQALSLGGGQGWPTTIYFDAAGRRTYVRQGGYTTPASLEADIRRYATGS